MNATFLSRSGIATVDGFSERDGARELRWHLHETVVQRAVKRADTAT